MVLAGVDVDLDAALRGLGDYVVELGHQLLRATAVTAGRAHVIARART